MGNWEDNKGQDHQSELVASSQSILLGNEIERDVCKLFFMLLLVQNMKYKFLFKLTQLMKYLSFWGLDNKFSVKYSPYLVFKPNSFKFQITSLY